MNCKNCGQSANDQCCSCDKGCDPANGRCVLYTGPETDHLHIPTGLNLNDIIIGLDSTIANLQDQILDLISGISVSVIDTPSISLSGNGSTVPLSANLKISSTPGNSISIASDGIYSPLSSQIFDVVRLSSNGLGLTYSFPHNSPTPPTGVIITPGSQDAADYSYADVDATYVTVFYNVAPLIGTNNLKYSYTVY